MSNKFDFFLGFKQWGMLLIFIVPFLIVIFGLPFWTKNPHLIEALLGGSLAALGTALGTLPVIVAHRLKPQIMDGMIGFGAGVMLAATAFSLIIPGIQSAESQGFSNLTAAIIIGISFLLGGLLLLSMEHFLPHEHFIKGLNTTVTHRLRRTWLFVFAIALHNLPEGLAIGVAFGGDNAIGASALSAGITIQDIPEGLVVALALLETGYSRRLCMAIGMLSGLIEPVAAVLGASIVTFSTSLLPWGMGLSAGAMLFVISHEVIPESHRKGHEAYATTGLMIGFVIMMILDTAFA